MASIVLENAHLRLEIDSATGAFDAIEKQSGAAWRRDPWEYSPGELTLRERSSGKSLAMDLGRAACIRIAEPSDGRTTIVFEGLSFEDAASASAQPIGVRLAVAVALESAAPRFELTIEELAFDESRFAFDSLLYPQRQFALLTDRDEGALALPYHQGALIPSGRFQVPLRDEWHTWDDLSWQASGLAWGTEGATGSLPIYGWNALSMPWFGASKGGSAFVAIIHTEDDAQAHFQANYCAQDDFSRFARKSPYPRICAATPRWLSVKGRFGYPRRVAYEFLPGGTHVEMALAYRRAAEAHGLIQTLEEKIERNPEVSSLFGAALINIDGGYPWYTDYASMIFTWKDLSRIAGELHDDLGLSRALICSWGGYSKLPPESYPLHPAWGSEADARAAVARIRALGFRYCAYHGYPAILSHADSFDPDEASIGPAGAMSGRWGGRCPATMMKYARADLPRVVAATGQTVDYTDMVTASGFRECYHPAHPLTRGEDRRTKLALLEYIRSLGLVNGSEVIQGYAVPAMDYAKGAMYVGLRYFLLRHIHAPLFNLVFKDCQVLFDGTVGTSRRMEYSNETLECLAYGIQPQFSFNMAHYAGARAVIRETAALMSDFQRDTALDRLASHKYLGGGYDAQQTEMSSGARVSINTDTAPFRTDEGLEIPARGFVIESPGAPPRKGAIQTAFRAL